MEYPEVKEFIYVNGCDDEVNVSELDSEYLQFRDVLRGKLEGEEVCCFPLNKKKALRMTKSILSSFFDLRSVWHLDRKGMDEYILNHQDDCNAYCEAYTMFVRDMSPYDVKVLFKRFQLDNVYIAGEVKSRLYYLIDKEDTVPKVSIDSITLSSRVTNLTIPTYAHELFHTRLQTVRGSVRYFENLELLSYFGGLFASSWMNDNVTFRAYEMALLQEVVSLVDEWEFLSKNEIVSYDEYLIVLEYLFSIIKAFKLFLIYSNGNDRVKEELVRNIQSILDGKNRLEDILASYGIDKSLDKSLVLHLKKV